jgi:hypothetical protein
VERWLVVSRLRESSADTALLAQTSKPNSSRCSPREAGRCSGQLCDATYDVLTLEVEIDIGELT